MNFVAFERLLGKDLVYVNFNVNFRLIKLNGFLSKGKMIRHERMGREVSQAAWQFPYLSIDATIQPITRTVLRVKLDIDPDFR